MASKKKAVNFEESLKALEALVTQMEKGDLSLEESLQAFEQGVALTRDCQARLASAEQQVRKLMEDQGEILLEPFDPLENDDE
jgi:exodeoxyribonuclease VII small subunit